MTQGMSKAKSAGTGDRATGSTSRLTALVVTIDRYASSATERLVQECAKSLAIHATSASPGLSCQWTLDRDGRTAMVWDAIHCPGPASEEHPPGKQPGA